MSISDVTDGRWTGEVTLHQTDASADLKQQEARDQSMLAVLQAQLVMAQAMNAAAKTQQRDTMRYVRWLLATLGRRRKPGDSS